MFGCSYAHYHLKKLIQMNRDFLAARGEVMSRSLMYAPDVRRAALERGIQRKAYLEDASMAEAPSPQHGSSEARIYAFALKTFRENTPDEASRLADRYVFFTQMFMRGDATGAD